MTGDSASGAPQPGSLGDFGGVAAGGAEEHDGDRAAIRSSPPLTGDSQVDSVLERMRGQLAELAADDLTGRRSVLAGADVALRALLDSEVDPRPGSDPAGAAESPGLPAR